MNLSQSQKKQFRSIGHSLHPLVTVATKGLSETVMAEINRALFDHELIKVKFSVGDNKGQLKTQLKASAQPSLG